MMSTDNEAEPVELSMLPAQITLEQEISEAMATIVVTCASQHPVLATEDLPDERSPQSVAQVTTPGLAPCSPLADTTKVVTKREYELVVTHANLMKSLQEAKNPPVPEEDEAGSCLSAEELE